MKQLLIFPKHREVLDILGENIKLARLRRKLSVSQVSERANISRSTLYLIEKGNEGVSIGNYFNVLRVLNLQQDFLKIASDDVLGRKIQDLKLLNDEVDCDKRSKKIRCTYLMINEKGHVKIGRSYNPKIRESTLQSEQPYIKLLAITHSDIESELHNKYNHKRIRGEWFDLSESEVFSIIDDYGFVNT
jgi:transcriptional regulator with XRE-family HTH domain